MSPMHSPRSPLYPLWAVGFVLGSCLLWPISALIIRRKPKPMSRKPVPQTLADEYRALWIGGAGDLPERKAG